MASVTIVGALIKLYVNNKIYKEVQGINMSIDYGEYEIFGIDSPYPQEIAGGKITVKGTITGIRIKNSGGIQAYNLRPLYSDSATAPYVSIRIQERTSGEDLWFIPTAKVSNERLVVNKKGVLELTFDFIGSMPQSPLDRS